MAIKNPQANFNWSLSLLDIDNARCQMLTPPSTEWTEHKQGTQGNSPDKKTPGKKIIGDITLEVTVPNTGDEDLWKLFDACETMDEAQYAGDGYIHETDVNGQSVQGFYIEEAWIKKVETANHETKGDNSDDLKRTVTFSIRDYRRVNV